MSMGKCIHNFTLDAKNIYNVVGIDSSYQWWFLSLGRDTNRTSADGKSIPGLKKRRKLVNEWLRDLQISSVYVYKLLGGSWFPFYPLFFYVA